MCDKPVDASISPMMAPTPVMGDRKAAAVRRTAVTNSQTEAPRVVFKAGAIDLFMGEEASLSLDDSIR
ncbi:hypothetical protein [Paenibacillus timonensis]|uniref:hypothetical protein n=1 Tax=Paenibacillus timonensis TaxID=225915 RepID=UPI0022DF18F0|nr:hypothetical protein [Paenibacillus timonensis]